MFIHASFDNLQFISHSYTPFQRLFVLLLRKVTKFAVKQFQFLNYVFQQTLDFYLSDRQS